MSILLADIDATCAALGYTDGQQYYAEPDALQGLKHLIWILRRDTDNHEYRRHLGHAKVLQNDLAYMLPNYVNDNDFADVLIRLLVILTSPTLLLYREGPPKDNHGRKIFLELIDILQDYKTAFVREELWIALYGKLKHSLGIDWALRSEEQNLLIERILIIIRNVLQIPANQEVEYRTDNDASLHDQVIWALHKSGLLDLILFIMSTTDEHQFHLHCVEILYLIYREQTAETLADASLQRSASEKLRDEQELMAARQRERQQRYIAKPVTGRHSRFGGTYVIRNVKSISDRDIICHQPLERGIEAIDFDREEQHQKRSFRLVKEDAPATRRSTFSVRLCLREYCIEVLNSAYNGLVNQVRRLLQRTHNTNNHDDSYLLWVIRFFMEFNRLHKMKVELISESLSVQCFHWVLTCIQHDMDMIVTDKQHSRLWAKRLHVALLTFRELLYSLLALQKLQDDNAALALFNMLLNNVCYVLEYRETILYLLMNYNESHSTKLFLRDVIETANIFIKMMEKFCKDEVVVQEKKRITKKRSNRKKSKKPPLNKQKKETETEEDLSNHWVEIATELSQLLTNQSLMDNLENQFTAYDAASDKSIEEQRDGCLIRIHKLLRNRKLDHAVALLRSAREIWPENDVFGAMTAAPEDELLLLREIFMHNISTDEILSDLDNDNHGNDDDDDEDNDDEVDEEEDSGIITVEKTFKFDDFLKRLVNGKIVRACVIVLNDWKQLTAKSLKAAVTILHRIAYGCSCPAMLYQATLFRIFQEVFHAARLPHHEELRRLGVYIIRKFVEIAPTNPKIYAELLFYKNLKEAYELENGYCDDYERGTKGTWSEAQELELRFLFDENQKNPATDKDVIDWILDNLIDKTRTRRGVLKKLKEMGLMFKAPTKKSNANRSNKNLWHAEEDEKLHNLYNQHRMDDSCLSKIVSEFEGRYNKQQIIKRMLQLGIIANKFEILPKKPQKRAKKSANHVIEENFEREEFSNEKHPKPSKKEAVKRRPIVKTPLEIGSIKFLLSKIDQEIYKNALDWLHKSLNEAADDFDPNEAIDEEDGVPLVPLLDIQKKAMDNDHFKKFLIALGMQPPVFGVESYWRIPTYLNQGDLKLRANIIIGNETELEQNNESENENDNENNDYNDEDVETRSDNDSDNHNDNDSDNNNNESDDDYLEILENNSHQASINLGEKRKHMQTLMFNESDDEDYETKSKDLLFKKHMNNMKNKTETSNNLMKKKKKQHTALNIDTNNFKENEKRKDDIKKCNTNIFDKLKTESLTKISGNIAKNDNSIHNLLQFNSEEYRKRLNELEEETNSLSDENNHSTINRVRRHNVIESDSEQEEETNMADTGKKVKTLILHDDEDGNGIDKMQNKKRPRHHITENKNSNNSNSDNDDENYNNHNNDNNDNMKNTTNENLPIIQEKYSAMNVSNEKPAKRRCLAIIDDTDDEDY